MKHERLKKYWEYKGCKRPADFARLINIAASNISEIDKRENNTKLLFQIKNNPECSDLNIEWLETGVGEMLLPVVADPAPAYPATKISEGIRPDQAELLQEWERLTDEERQLIKGVIKSMRGRRE